MSSAGSPSFKAWHARIFSSISKYSAGSWPSSTVSDREHFASARKSCTTGFSRLAKIFRAGVNACLMLEKLMSKFSTWRPVSYASLTTRSSSEPCSPMPSCKSSFSAHFSKSAFSFFTWFARGPARSFCCLNFVSSATIAVSDFSIAACKDAGLLLCFFFLSGILLTATAVLLVAIACFLPLSGFLLRPIEINAASAARSAAPSSSPSSSESGAPPTEGPSAPASHDAAAVDDPSSFVTFASAALMMSPSSALVVVLLSVLCFFTTWAKLSLACSSSCLGSPASITVFLEAPVENLACRM